MGLSPLPAARWIEPDTNYPQLVAHKIRLRKELADAVYQAYDESLAAQHELAGALKNHLLQHHANLYEHSAEGLVYRPTGQRLPHADQEPLWQSSLWLADDLLILQNIEGNYRLTAASLCSPSHWLLEEKMGCAIAEIHAAVPKLNHRIGGRIQRFFDHLKPSHPVERFNWSLQADDALCQRDLARPFVPSSTPLFYRTERQTLTRLPDSQAIVFTIRVQLHPLSILTQVPGCIEKLIDVIDAAAPGIARYKNFGSYRDALAKYLTANTTER